MISYQLFVEGLLQRVTRVRNGDVQKRVVTKTPYKMKDTNAVLMSTRERQNRKAGAKISVKTRRDKHEQAKRKRAKSNHIRAIRHIEDKQP